MTIRGVYDSGILPQVDLQVSVKCNSCARVSIIGMTGTPEDLELKGNCCWCGKHLSEKEVIENMITREVSRGS